MEDRIIDIRISLDYIGSEWKFGGSVTDGTQECWNNVSWEDERDKPSWDELIVAYEDNVFYTATQEIEKEYSDKVNALALRMNTVLLNDGAQQEQKILAIQQEYAAAKADRQTKLDALWSS